METRLKQRLIGAAVLVGLGVIFIPMLFEGSNSQQKIVANTIPASPQTPKVVQLDLPNAPRLDLIEKSQAAATEQAVASEANAAFAELQVTNAEMPMNTAPAVMADEPEKMANNSVIKRLKAQMDEVNQIRTKLVRERELLAEERQVLLSQRAKLAKADHPITTTEPEAQKAMLAAATPAVKIGKPSDPAARSNKHPLIKNNQVNIAELHAAVKNHSQSNSAWVVQLASFNDASNADRLVKKLAKRGFSAYSREFHTTSGSHYRVFVGPSVKRERAQLMAAQLDHLVHLGGIIVPYNAVNLS